MTRKLLLVVLSIVAVTQFSCLKSIDCDFSECEVVAPQSEITVISNYLAANTLTATQHCSGLFYTVNTTGAGKKPDACSNVHVKYVGRLANGNVFDQQITDGLSIGLNQVIRGWRVGIPLMNAGGSITLYIPPTLGYGAQDLRDGAGNVVIPGNSMLIFNVDLVNAQ